MFPRSTRNVLPLFLALVATGLPLASRAATPEAAANPEAAGSVEPFELRITRSEDGWIEALQVPPAQLPPSPPAVRPPQSPRPTAPPRAVSPAAAPSLPAAPGAGTGSALVPPPPTRQLVLDRARRQLTVLEQGRELRRYPVAVGMPGWETPVGRFEVIEKTANPVWEHPATGQRFPPGPENPLGTRWIGFYRDCNGRSGFNGKEHLEVKGCVTAGFHGTPVRSSVGRAVSHGCVRLFDEHARELFDLVSLGTPVTVLP